MSMSKFSHSSAMRRRSASKLDIGFALTFGSIKLDFILHRARSIARDELFLALGFSRISLFSQKKRPARRGSTLIGCGSASGYGRTCDRSKEISLTFLMPPSAAARQKFKPLLKATNGGQSQSFAQVDTTEAPPKKLAMSDFQPTFWLSRRAFFFARDDLFLVLEFSRISLLSRKKLPARRG